MISNDKINDRYISSTFAQVIFSIDSLSINSDFNTLEFIFTKVVVFGKSTLPCIRSRGPLVASVKILF